MTKEVSEFKAYAQIQTQPAAVEELLQAPEPVDGAAELIGDAQRVYTVGIGTSYNAALLAAHWLRSIDRDAVAWASYDFVVYGPRLEPGDVVLVFSHSGRKHYSRQALERCREAGVPSLWMAARSPDADNPATVVLHTVGRESSPMFTVSHTAAMALTARMVDRVRPGALGDLGALPRALRGALGLEAQVAELADAWRARGCIIASGAGPHEASALETAIKINEGARMRCHGYAIEQFLHGPQAQLQTPETPLGDARLDDIPMGDASIGDTCDALLVFTSSGHSLERTEVLARFGIDVGVPVGWVAPAPGPAGVTAFAVPDVGEALAPVVEVVVSQLLAAYLAARRGVDCDAFRRNEPAFKRAYERYSL